MVGFIEDQNVDLTHFDETIEQALIENLARADNYHTFGEVIIPDLLIPEVWSHRAENVAHILVEIVLQHSRLLKHKSHALSLVFFQYLIILEALNQHTKKKAIRGALPSARSISSCCRMCLSRRTAIKVFPDPGNFVNFLVLRLIIDSSNLCLEPRWYSRPLLARIARFGTYEGSDPRSQSLAF